MQFRNRQRIRSGVARRSGWPRRSRLSSRALHPRYSRRPLDAGRSRRARGPDCPLRSGRPVGAHRGAERHGCIVAVSECQPIGSAEQAPRQIGHHSCVTEGCQHQVGVVEGYTGSGSRWAEVRAHNRNLGDRGAPAPGASKTVIVPLAARTNPWDT